MNALEIMTNVAARAEKKMTDTLANGEDLKTYLFNSLNLVYLFFNNKYLWPWREKFCTIQTVPNYTTGTVRVTNGSRSVDLGTGFTSAMIGRYLKLNRDLEMYEIVDVPDSSTLTLRDPYIGSSSSGETFIIWKKYYDLPPDVSMGSKLSLWKGYGKASPMDFKVFDQMFNQNAYLNGDPIAWSWYGINRKVSTYNTGTVQIAADSNTLTLTGGSFWDNVFEGSEIEISGTVYNVESIDSAPQVTLVQKAITDIPAGTSYVATTRNRSQIMLSSVPNPAITLNVSYPKRTYKMNNDKDVPEIWEDYHLALCNLLYVYLSEKISSDKTFSWLTIAEAQVKEVYRNIIEPSPMDQAPLVGNKNISEYRKGLYS